VKKTYDYLHNYRSYSPDGVCRVGAIYEVVVEGVARSSSFACPEQCLVGVGSRKLGQRRS
jgi:hypothetical protein